jgi:1,4-dihydroxy-2-naphthoyl-CoA hydrolase
MPQDSSRLFPSTLKVEALNALGHGTLGETLGIRFTDVGERHLEATMPVDARTRQPMGLLHGGASVALAETLGSVASAVLAGPDRAVVGLEINANHLRSKRDGWVVGRVEPLHVGRRTHVWEVKIRDEAGTLLCASRMTVAVLERGGPAAPGADR